MTRIRSKRGIWCVVCIASAGRGWRDGVRRAGSTGLERVQKSSRKPEARETQALRILRPTGAGQHFARPHAVDIDEIGEIAVRLLYAGS